MENAWSLLHTKTASILTIAAVFGLIFNPFTSFPYTFCVIIAVILCFVFIRDRDLKALNFKKLSFKTFTIILMLYGGIELAMDFVIQPVINKIFNEPVDYSAFNVLEGNTLKYAKYLIYAWISAAFGEELLFRAFVFSQLEKIIGNKKISILLISTVLFALPHLYQGYAGLIVTFIFGLIFGIIYLKFKNIWINILIHGLIDTVFITLAYFGLLSFYD